jgi:hypothetical protein
MRLPLFLALFFTSITNQILAGNDKPVTGARALGMGGTSLTLRDVWSTHNNIGALSGVKEFTGGLVAQNNFNNALFRTAALGLALPLTNIGTAGLSVRRMGNNLYSESSVGLGFSQRMGIASVGLQADYLETSIRELGTRRNVAINFGGMAELTPRILFGGMVYNINQAKMAEFQDERIPTVMRAGLSYLPSKSVLLTSEIEKDIDYKASVRFGIEYQIIQNVYLRTGFSTRPNNAYGGVGVHHKRFSFDFSIMSHTKLGLSQALSLNILLSNPSATPKTDNN